MTDPPLINYFNNKHDGLTCDVIPYSNLVKLGFIRSFERFSSESSNCDLMGTSLSVVTCNLPSKLNKQPRTQRKVNPLLLSIKSSSKDSPSSTFCIRRSDDDLQSDSSVTLVLSENTQTVVNTIPCDQPVTRCSGDSLHFTDHDGVILPGNGEDDGYVSFSYNHDSFIHDRHGNSKRIGNCLTKSTESEITVLEIRSNGSSPKSTPIKKDIPKDSWSTSDSKSVLSPSQIAQNNRRLTRRWNVVKADNKTLQLGLSQKEHQIVPSVCSSYCDLSSSMTEAIIPVSAAKKQSKLTRLKSVFRSSNSVEKRCAENMIRSGSTCSAIHSAVSSSQIVSNSKLTRSLKTCRKNSSMSTRLKLSVRKKFKTIDSTLAVDQPLRKQRASSCQLSLPMSRTNTLRSNDSVVMTSHDSLMTSPEEDLIASCFYEKEDVITRCFTVDKRYKDPVFLNF